MINKSLFVGLLLISPLVFGQALPDFNSIKDSLDKSGVVSKSLWKETTKDGKKKQDATIEGAGKQFMANEQDITAMYIVVGGEKATENTLSATSSCLSVFRAVIPRLTNEQVDEAIETISLSSKVKGKTLSSQIGGYDIHSSLVPVNDEALILICGVRTSVY